MALAETIIESPRFPDDISYGSEGGPGYSTDVITVNSGIETRNVNWSQARHTYNAAFGIRNQTYLSTLVNFFHAVKGKAYGFRYKDWSDFTSASDGISAHSDTDQEIGTGDGVEVDFQLSKTYIINTQETVRLIQKPVSGTVVISVDDSTVSPANYSVDYTTGIVTFNTAPADTLSVKAGFEFDVPVRFDTDTLAVNLEMYEHGTTDVPLVELKL